MALVGTTVWEIRADGAATNGGGFNAARDAVNGVDYSQQAAAQLALTDVACTTGGAVITSATGGFTHAMEGSVCYLAGTNFTTGWYEIVTYTDTGQVTLDRDPTNGSNGSSGTLNVGGALNGIGTLGLVLTPVAQAASGMKAYVRGGTHNLTGTTINTSGGPLDLDETSQDNKSFLLKGYATDAANRDAFTGTRPIIDVNGNAPTSVIEIKGTLSEGHVVAFIEIDGESRAVNGIVGNGQNTDRAVSCIVRDCDGTAAFDKVTAVLCYATSCSAIGFSNGHCVGCIAETCTTGFGPGIYYVACIAKNCTGDGFQSSYLWCINCVSYDNGGDGFDLVSTRSGVYVNCVSYHDAGYSFNTSAECILINCASDGAASGRTNVTPFIDIGNPGTLTGDPFANHATLDFKPDATASEGMLLRALGASPYGQTGFIDIGAVQHEDAGGGGGGRRTRARLHGV